MKPFINRILICVVPVLISAWIVWSAYRKYPEGCFKLGTDLAGGTNLIYDVVQDPEKEKDPDLMTKLIASLKRRIDPADLYNITIRRVSDTRLEIILPTGSRKQV